MKRYKLNPIIIAPPNKGFLIQTPTGKTLFDTRPRGIVRELNRLNDRIKQLEEDLMDANNKHAALVADVVLYEDRGERIKRLEDIISRASSRFFRDGSDIQVANGMLTILEEVRLK